jgi:hypothetical protein
MVDENLLSFQVCATYLCFTGSALKQGLYDIITTFYESLPNYKFQDGERLQHYIDFCIP